MAKKKKAPDEAFVVVRRGWSECYGNDWSFYLVSVDDDPKRVLGRPVAVCADKAAAEARAEQLEREARETLNPFVFVGNDEYSLRNVTSLSPEQFADRLKKLFPKARLPKENADEERDWFGWWSKLADGITEEQWSAVWGLLDRLKFYAVMKAEMAGAVR